MSGRILTLRTVVIAIAMTLCFVAVAPALAKQENKPAPPPVRYERILGPFPIDGHDFSVKLNVICYKESQHEGLCDDDDEETISSFKITDENGKTRFSKSFPISLVHNFGRHLVSARLLEGKEHQALELRYETLPSRPDTGESIQLFALQSGMLKPLDREPLRVSGRPGRPPDRPKEEFQSAAGKRNATDLCTHELFLHRDSYSDQLD